MNKQNKREGFVGTAEPIEDSAPIIDNLPPPEPPEPGPVREVWPIRVRLLHKQVRGTKGDMLQELTFREPTGGDINRVGNPCMVDQNGDVIILDRKMTTMIAQLSGILQPFIEAMDPRDWNSCAYRLRGFFIPDPAAW
jgi:hypothetical protein